MLALVLQPIHLIVAICFLNIHKC